MLELRFPAVEYQYKNKKCEILFYLINTSEDQEYNLNTTGIRIDYPLSVNIKDPETGESIYADPISFDSDKTLKPYRGIEFKYVIERKEKLDYDEVDEFEIEISIGDQPVRRYKLNINP